MPTPCLPLNRRALLGSGLLLLAPAMVPAAVPASRRLAFTVHRNDTQIGEHLMTFAGDPASPVVTTEVSMAVKLGPVPVFRYRHHAVERWAAARFQALETSTQANGKSQTVSARATPAGVLIETARGRTVAPADAVPLTHWNRDVFAGPLFNPQEGRMLKVQVSRPAAGHVALRGEAEIDDYYDPDGVWRALRGRLKDGSAIEYRRA